MTVHLVPPPPPDVDPGVSPEAEAAAAEDEPPAAPSPVAGLLPAHSLEAEQAVLSAVILAPERLGAVRALLEEPAVFFADSHQVLWRSILALATSGGAIDLVTLAHELRARGHLERAGGASYLAEIIDATPAVGNVEAHARIVRDAWLRRRTVAAAHRVVATGYQAPQGAAQERAWREHAAAAVTTTEVEPPRVWPAAKALAQAIAEAPCPVRLPTGIARLDEWTRGGVPLGRRVVIVGAPGAGKTALAVQWAHEWAPSARVVYLAADQSDEDVLCRIGQRLGLARDELDGVSGAAQHRSAWLAAAERLAELPGLIVLDGATHSVEDALTCALASDAPARVLVVDSLQTARCEAADGAPTRREALDAALTAVRGACSRGVAAVLVSEMARGGYRSSDPSQMISALAAAKESGAVEYGADLLLGLRSVADEPDLVDVEVAKSRLGPRGELCLRLNRARATLDEMIDAPDPAAGAQDRRRAARRATVAQDAEDLREVLAAHPLGLGVRDLRAALRAAGFAWGRDRLDGARAALADGVGGVRLVDRGQPGAGARLVLEPREVCPDGA